MKYLGKLLTLIMVLGSFVLFGQNINSSKSTINFKTKGAKGTLSNLAGKVTFDESDIANAAFDVTVNMSSMNTGNEKRDDHLKTADFFDVFTFPNAKFKSIGVTKAGDKYETLGKLDMHGFKKDAKIVFTYDASAKMFTGTMIVDASKHEVGGNKHSAVEVSIVCYLK